MNNKKICYLPVELKLHIQTYLPIVNCQYCNNKVTTFEKYNIYCSYKCNFYHHLVIIKRLNQILILYLFLQIRFFLIMVIQLGAISLNIFTLCISFYLLYSHFFEFDNIHLISCHNYH